MDGQTGKDHLGEQLVDGGGHALVEGEQDKE
jgi:hypothetical protein